MQLPFQQVIELEDTSGVIYRVAHECGWSSKDVATSRTIPRALRPLLSGYKDHLAGSTPVDRSTSAGSGCGVATRTIPSPISPRPTTFPTTFLLGTTFSRKMTPEMRPIQARFIIPSRSSTSISGQLDPRQYIPWMSPARIALRPPGACERCCGAGSACGDQQWRRQACLSGVS